MSFTPQILSPTELNIKKVANCLKNGEVVAIPTETVYGLAADALNAKAVEKIFLAKGRPQDNPLIVHINTVEMLNTIVSTIPKTALQLATCFWPGPLTIVLPRSANISNIVSGGLNTVGVRMPAHPIARAIITATNKPLAAPSANLSGSPSPTTAMHVLQDMNTRIPYIVDGGNCTVGVESTVLSLIDIPTILRPGFITAEEIASVLQTDVKIADAVIAPLKEDESAASPGMKYKHYSPKANIILLKGDFPSFKQFIENKIAQTKENEMIWALCFEEDAPNLTTPYITYGRQEDSATQANALFSALRTLDEKGAKTVYARMPKKDGIGLAVYNRILRAAAFQVKEL